MKRIHLVAVVALIMITLIFGYSQSPLQSPQTRATAIQTVESQRQAAAARFTIEREVGTQQRINRYFHGDVVPKLKNCWSNVQGKGTIAVKYTYAKAGARWKFNGLETDQSTLPRGQDNVALKCMLDAVRGTSFPVEGAESTENKFVLSWEWPVPFPANANQLTTAMFAARRASGGSGGDGCDGHGAPAKCYSCSGKDSSCLRVCVGIDVPCTVRLDSNNNIVGCSVAGNACASGGLFGVSVGSRVIY